ncbi:MAG: STAS domain-containing protein [Mycobacterium sp.]|nr:STAS domain-containing protein [Mycobacterium sp.]
MSTRLRVDTERRDDGRVVLHAGGEIDAGNVAVFAEALAAAAVSSQAVTVDLSAVQYLDSAAINVLVSHGGPLHIVANPLLIPVLRISGVAELATVSAASRGET